MKIGKNKRKSQKINKKSAHLPITHHINVQKSLQLGQSGGKRREEFVHVTDSECTGRTPMDDSHIEHHHPSSHMISWTS